MAQPRAGQPSEPPEEAAQAYRTVEAHGTGASVSEGRREGVIRFEREQGRRPHRGGAERGEPRLFHEREGGRIGRDDVACRREGAPRGDLVQGSGEAIGGVSKSEGGGDDIFHPSMIAEVTNVERVKRSAGARLHRLRQKPR
jgi:hypothetical protein